MTYSLWRKVYLVDFSNGAKAHFAQFAVRKRREALLRLNVPCRASLCKLLTHFYFHSCFSRDLIFTSITDEDYSIISTVKRYRKKYSYWRKCYEILESEGLEKAREWFVEKAKFLAMLEVMEGK